MPFFSRNKSKKAPAENEKPLQEQKPQQQTTGPQKKPYRHTPKHAAADAIGNSGSQDRSGDRSQIIEANEKRLKDAKKRHTLASPAMSRALSIAPGSEGARGAHQSSQMVGKDMGVPAVPPPPNFSKFASSTPKANVSGQRKTFYGGQKQQLQQVPPFSNPMPSNPKMQVAARDQGFFGPSPSQDSGYGSALHSPEGSVSDPITDSTSLPLLHQNNNDFLPSMSLTEALSLEPAFSEKSFSEDVPEPRSTTPEPKTIASDVKQPSAEERQRNYLRKKSNENFSRPHGGDNYSGASSRSTKTFKHARFEEPSTESMPQPRQDWRVIKGGADQIEHPPRVESKTVPVRPPRPLEGLAAPPEHQAVTNWSPQRMKSPPLSMERQPSFARAHRASSPVPIAGAQFLALDRIASNEQTRPSLPPLSILEGLKVNKRGRILDEEGDAIGELVEGDIMDCVRQKANANGDVLDEYGAVVGRVQTLPRAGARTMSSGSTSSQPRDFFQTSYSQQQANSSPHLKSARPASMGPSSFPMAYQPSQYSWPTQQYSTSYAGDDTHRAHPQARLPAVTPIDIPGSEIIELDASSIKRRSIEEHEAIMDLSDIFLPTSKALLALDNAPSIPDRSPLRPATPSSTASHTANTATSTHSSCSSRTSQDLALDQHIEAIKLPHVESEYSRSRAELEVKPLQTARTVNAAPPVVESPVVKPMVKPTQKLAPVEPVPQPESKRSQLKPVVSMDEISHMLRGPAPPKSPTKPEEQSKPAFIPVPKPAPLLRSKSEANRLGPSPFAKANTQPPVPSLPRAQIPQPPATPPPESGSLEPRSPFAYKGDIPAANGAQPALPQQPPNRLQNAKSPPPLPSFPRTAFTSSLPASPFAGLNSAPLGAGGPPMPAGPKRVATTGNLAANGAMMAMQRPALKPRHTIHSPLIRSPLASHETTPPDSDGSATSDEGKTDGPSTAIKAANTAAAASYLAAARSRAPSMKSNAPSIRSVATTAEKPRTYFTHGGRVTVGPGEMPPAVKAAEDAKRSASNTPDIETQSVKEKKKRFSVWGNKKEKK